MREIKFRAWHKLLKEMYLDGWHGKCVGEGGANSTNDHLRFLQNHDIELMQCTGKKDASLNPKDIYEGDLFGTEDEVFGEVYFDTDFAGFCVKYPNGGWSTLGEHLLEKGNHREVIGNIYDNPEPLSQGEEA